MHSIICQRFGFLQSFSLILLMWDQRGTLIRLLIILLQSLVAYNYTHSRIYWLIEQMSTQIREFYIQFDKVKSVYLQEGFEVKSACGSHLQSAQVSPRNASFQRQGELLQDL
mmetsp:Transcript_17799/g.30168  ORF Transcript_17799/g.30168 Transcript_17799/m.30168 type:complete len:112 (+) Transcript_17799:570-905(+)